MKDLQSCISRQVRARRVPENSPKRYLSFAFLGVVLFCLGQHAQAAGSEFGLSGISLGASLPTPMGVNYQSLERNLPFGLQAEAWTDTGWMKSTLKIHTAAYFDSFAIRNFNTAKIQTMSFFAGMHAFGGKYSETFAPFIGLDIGAMYDWMTFSNASNAVANSGLAFATQIVPGVDIPVTKRFGVVFEMPVRFIFVKTTWVMWSPSLSVRFDLGAL